MDRDRVEAQLHGLEQLLEDPPPLLSLVILANGAGLMVAHPMLTAAERTPEQYAAQLGLIHAQLVDVAAHFARLLAEAGT